MELVKFFSRLITYGLRRHRYDDAVKHGQSLTVYGLAMIDNGEGRPSFHRSPLEAIAGLLIVFAWKGNSEAVYHFKN